ncbi:PREDICTED: uncharacterized protein LOC108568466 [Nicrophorus vespilloides]|uniref:Uncharacterized protein LOC108568466 n=1 Tax=Nicrophorus vespilloides TaxID=110193 RepID=A0ABM1NE19_NICVS|nr:PREDICTED: uncharacterized protein LOC108568466 [Nicrophorus vespilloides]
MNGLRNGLRGPVQILVLHILIFIGSKEALILKNLSVPLVADPREDMNLDCIFDMGNEVMYAVKWYKDDHEFFRFMPHQQPHTMTFPVAGVHLVPGSTDCGEDSCKVRLTRLTRDHSTGSYRCEISTEAPSFRLASITHSVTVAAMPRDQPRIEGAGNSYYVGDILVADCTSAPADPTPVVVWYINNKTVSSDFLGEATTSAQDRYGLSSRTASLRFALHRNHTGHLELRCEVFLPSVPMRPQTITKVIPIKTHLPQVNNEKLHWPNSSSSPPRMSLILILLLAGFRWRQSC